MDYFAQYGLFFAKTLTIILGIAFILVLAMMLGRRRTHEGELSIKHLNTRYDAISQALKQATLPKSEWQQVKKNIKKQKKILATKKKRIYVLNFEGDVQAQAVGRLREEITALLLVATPEDEVIVKIDSPGGVVSGYGLAASQLLRIREHNIPLIASIDKVAASGGYMMACVASKIIAAPFAIVGSIGVIAQLPNFHRFLKKHDIDFEQISGGEFKRTLSLFGENTPKAREKVQEEVNETHELFKQFVHEHRPEVDITLAATGEYWLGRRALELKLIDSLITSDEYLLQQYEMRDIYELSYQRKQKLVEKIQGNFKSLAESVLGYFK